MSFTEYGVVLKTSAWFEEGEVLSIRAWTHNKFVTTKPSKLRAEGFFIDNINIRILSKKKDPEYFL